MNIRCLREMGLIFLAGLVGLQLIGLSGCARASFHFEKSSPVESQLLDSNGAPGSLVTGSLLTLGSLQSILPGVRILKKGDEFWIEGKETQYHRIEITSWIPVQSLNAEVRPPRKDDFDIQWPNARAQQKIESEKTYFIYEMDPEGFLNRFYLKVSSTSVVTLKTPVALQKDSRELVPHRTRWNPWVALPKKMPLEFHFRGGEEFFPFYLRRDQNPEQERLVLKKNEAGALVLSMSQQPYGDRRGFKSLGTQWALDDFDQIQVEDICGKMTAEIELKPSDLIAVLMENYQERLLMLLKVREITPQHGVRFDAKILFIGDSRSDPIPQKKTSL